MSTTIMSGQAVTQDPSDVRTYVIDWGASALDAGVLIVTSSFQVHRMYGSGSLSLANATIVSGARKTSLVISGGYLGGQYLVSNKITTSESPSQTLERSFTVRVADL